MVVLIEKELFHLAALFIYILELSWTLLMMRRGISVSTRQAGRIIDRPPAPTHDRDWCLDMGRCIT